MRVTLNLALLGSTPAPAPPVVRAWIWLAKGCRVAHRTVFDTFLHGGGGCQKGRVCTVSRFDPLFSKRCKTGLDTPKKCSHYAPKCTCSETKAAPMTPRTLPTPPRNGAHCAPNRTCSETGTGVRAWKGGACTVFPLRPPPGRTVRNRGSTRHAKRRAVRAKSHRFRLGNGHGGRSPKRRGPHCFPASNPTVQNWRST